MVEQECLMPSMKASIKTAIETNISCAEGEIDRAETKLKKTEDQSTKGSLQRLINIYKFHIGWLKGLNDEVEKIRECHK